MLLRERERLDAEAFETLLQGPGEIVARLLVLRKFQDLGPAVYLDAAKYAARRAKDLPNESRLLYEVFYAYFLPQFEGMEDRRATTLYRTIAQFLQDAPDVEAFAKLRTERDIEGAVFVSYLVTNLLVPIVAAFFALAERSRVGTTILLLGVATVAGLEVRLWDVWGGRGA